MMHVFEIGEAMLTTKPVIALVGAPAWAATGAALLAQAGFEPVSVYPRAHFINQLLDRYPVLLLVDGDDSGWRSWIVAVRVEQSTRRIPILVVAADASRQLEVQAVSGARFLASETLEERLVALVQQQARIVPPAVREELRCQCQAELPPLARQGIEQFNAGAYYAQHDAFEALWLAETGPVRELYRAILQVGVAYYHITRGNHAGGVKMLQRCVQWFAMLPDVCQGVDVRQLREDATRVRLRLQAMTPAEIATFDRELIRPVRLIKP